MPDTAMPIAVANSQAVVSGSAFAKAVKLVASAKGKEIPVICCVKVDCTDGALRLTATNLDIQVSQTIPCASVGAFSRLVDAGALRRVADVMSKSRRVTLTKHDGSIGVSDGDISYRLLADMSVDDFPEERTADGQWHTINSGSLCALLSRTWRYASSEETRYYLNGVYLRSGHQGALTAAATNGHFLVYAPAPDIDLQMVTGIIVPTAGVKILLSVLKGAGMEVAHVSVRGRLLTVRIPSRAIEVIIKTIDGTFPDYEKVAGQIGGGETHHVTVDRPELIEAIRRVAVVSTEKGKAIRLKVGRGDLTISAIDVRHGEATVTIPAHVSEAEGLGVGLNSRYALTMLADFHGQSVTLRGIRERAPMDMCDDGSNVRALIMPMRV